MFTRFKPVLGMLASAVLVLALSAAMFGCSVVERVGSWLDDNPLVAQVAVRQAVVRFISAGQTVDDVSKRKADAIAVLEQSLIFLDGNPRARVDAIMTVLHASIPWDEMGAPDKLMVMDILMFVQQDLERKQAQNELSNDAALALRSLLETALSAAQNY